MSVCEKSRAAWTAPTASSQVPGSILSAECDLSPSLKAELAKVVPAMTPHVRAILAHLRSLKGVSSSQTDQRVRSAVLDGFFQAAQFHLSLVELALQVYVGGDDIEETRLRIDKFVSYVEQCTLNPCIVPCTDGSFQQIEGRHD